MNLFMLSRRLQRAHSRPAQQRAFLQAHEFLAWNLRAALTALQHHASGMHEAATCLIQSKVVCRSRFDTMRAQREQHDWVSKV